MVRLQSGRQLLSQHTNSFTLWELISMATMAKMVMSWEELGAKTVEKRMDI